MQEQHIETTAQLEALCQQLQGSQWLALDTEFMREKTYHPRLCLLQLSNGELAASIDPLQLEQFEPLLELLYDPAIVKVFHAARQDLEIFHLLWQRLPAPLFDTQLAAALLGYGDQTGYGTLVEQALGVTLEKGHSRTDWSRRPLSDAQRRYALDDVVYLGQLYPLLRDQLAKKQRLHWLDEEFAELADPALYRVDPQQAWQRIKGKQRLKGVQLAVLQALAAWRETRALEADRPRRWIVKDEVLTDLARRQPRQLEQLSQIRGVEPTTLKRHGDRWLALIAEAQQLPKTQWPRLERTPARLDASQEALVDLLHGCLRLVAEQQQITPLSLAGRKELERLVAGERSLGLLHGWRAAMAGHTLLEVLEGQRWPRVEEGRLRLD